MVDLNTPEDACRQAATGWSNLREDALLTHDEAKALAPKPDGRE
jgi:hypothetical protein